MSTFAVTIEEIEEITPIEGADYIVQAKLTGIDYSFVVGKDTFVKGDHCLYFPIDSVIPQSLQEKLGVVGKLDGPQKDRVRTVKLKKVKSQGIAGDLKLIAPLLAKKKHPKPEEITAFLGVTKYERPVSPDELLPKTRKRESRMYFFIRKWAYRIFGRKLIKKFGWFKKTGEALLPLSDLGLRMYDIENAERYRKVIDSWMDLPVWVVLKLEGQNAAVFFDGKDAYVNQRNYTIINNEDHRLKKIARNQRYIDFAKALYKKYQQDVIVYYEACGSDNGAEPITGNIYKLKVHRGWIFDISIGGKFLSIPDAIFEVSEFFGEPMPGSSVDSQFAFVLCRGMTLRQWLDGKTVQEASQVKGIMYSGYEEGIVIHPAVEHYSPEIGGRAILKARSPEYLAREKG